MKLVDTSVRRPVGVIMIVLAILALGFVSLRGLAIDLFPEVELPIAAVATNYNEAGPEEVEQQVSRPLESSLSSIEGLESLQSQSQPGSSLIIMSFSTGVDLDNTLLEVRENIDQVSGFLPDGAGEPNVLRFNPSQLPVMWVGLTGEDQSRLQSIAEDQVVPYLERQGGVASVTIEGGESRVIDLVMDQGAMNQYGITTQDVQQALQGANSSGAGGVIEYGNKNLQVRVNGEFDSVDDIARTIVQTQQGTQVHVEEIAEVQDTVTDSAAISQVNGESSIVLSIMKKSEGNTVEVADNINTAIEELEGELPANAKLEVVIDTSTFITQSINSVVQNMVIGGFFALAILLLFLKSIRATIVVGVSIPIAIISTFTLLYFTGETLNVLTMGGLALGVGMMVDSSIVILENIVYYRQRGYSMVEAAKTGASELAPAVIASTTTTLVVFLPIVFVEGIASTLFTPFALTVAFALISSLVVAVTLIPMLSSKLLSKAMEDNGRRYWFDRFLDQINNGYCRILRKVLKYRKTTVFTTLVLIIASLALVPFIGAEFMPQTDQGQVTINVETASGSSIEETEYITNQVNEHLAGYNDIIETNYLSVGGDDLLMGGGAVNEANYTLQLVPAEDREMTTEAFVQDLNESLMSIAGAEISVSASGQSLSTGDPVQVQLSGPEHEVLADLADEVVAEISTIEGVINPASSVSESQPQLNVLVDRERAAQYGLTHQQIMAQVQTGFTGQVVMNYRENGEEIDVRVTFPEEMRNTINDLNNMQIQSPAGSSIPLNEVADFEQRQGPATLTRNNQQPQVDVSSDITGRDLGSVSEDIEAALENMNLPEEYSFSIGGEVQDMQEAFADLALALIFSIFLVYAVMAVQFENFLFPLVIMFSLPATVIGILGGLFITGKPLSITAFIGIIMLGGIVVNNAIVLVDYINIVRRRGIERFEAILEAGTNRMRPILMTTLTTILAMVPLALGFGEGAETQQPLAITIIFGLSISSIFTLLLIPVVYTFFDDLSRKVVKKAQIKMK